MENDFGDKGLHGPTGRPEKLAMSKGGGGTLTLIFQRHPIDAKISPKCKLGLGSTFAMTLEGF